MPLMIKLNRNIMKVYLCLDNGHFITVLMNAYGLTVDDVLEKLKERHKVTGNKKVFHTRGEI